MAKPDESARVKRKSWSVLWELTRGYRPRMAWLALTSFASAMLEAGFVVVVTGIVLALVGGQDSVGPVLGRAFSIAWALLVAGVAVVLRLALNMLTVRVTAGLVALVQTEQRQQLAHAYLQASWEVQQAEAAGRLQELLTSFINRITSATTWLAQAITASLSLLAFMSASFVINPLASVVVLGSLAILGGALGPLRALIRKRSADANHAGLVFAKTVAELGSLGQEMQTFGVRDRFESQIDRAISESTEQARVVQMLNGTLTPVYTFLAYSGVIGAVAILRVTDLGNLVEIGSVMLLMMRSLSYAQQLLAVSGQLASAIPSLEMIHATATYYASNNAANGREVPHAVAPIELIEVSFVYTPDRPALADVNFRIEPGEMIGAIGPSGAGKSTLAQLLLGLRAPSQGSVLVSGVDLREVDRSWWTQRVSFVAQDPLLFTGTVAENIRFFRDGLTESDLERAARQANVLDDIGALPNGFDTHLGERGSQLSGGQRQRLSIARALVGNPELLILDEPTSALDGHSEALVRDTLAALQGRITIVIIAHRMSTLDLCDRIVVIENGRVSGLGEPATLRAANAFYRNALETAGMK